MTVCPQCNACHQSYKSPTEHDPEIIIECLECGYTWGEPNHMYIKAQQREMEEEYYDKFERRTK